MASTDTQKDKKKQPLSALLDFVSFATVLPPAYEEDVSPIQFYCKKCKIFTTVKKHPKKLAFSCDGCKTPFKDNTIVYGTSRALSHFYNIKD
ncbi:hypothetical protein COB57_01600 [Candidatus Peregrinibacteria bacterium]|nr:MAG: hypothetical protein COB57_01600 [Candidatus Peregrinibacteria bacterium]